MEFLFWTVILYNVLALTGFGAFVGALKRRSIWLSRGFPPALKAAIPPLTQPEKRTAMALGTPLLAFLILVPLAWMGYARIALEQSFLVTWAEGFVILFSFNVVDLVVIDWLILCFLTPKFLVAPGTEGHPGYKDYGFHFRAFLRGTILVALMTLLFAGVVEILAWAV